MTRKGDVSQFASEIAARPAVVISYSIAPVGNVSACTKACLDETNDDVVIKKRWADPLPTIAQLALQSQVDRQSRSFMLDAG
jgi:hypothetical protein